MAVVDHADGRWLMDYSVRKPLESNRDANQHPRQLYGYHDRRIRTANRTARNSRRPRRLTSKAIRATSQVTLSALRCARQESIPLRFRRAQSQRQGALSRLCRALDRIVSR